jgi:hypothetical protein
MGNVLEKDLDAALDIANTAWLGTLPSLVDQSTVSGLSKLDQKQFGRACCFPSGSDYVIPPVQVSLRITRENARFLGGNTPTKVRKDRSVARLH